MLPCILLNYPGVTLLLASWGSHLAVFQQGKQGTTLTTEICGTNKNSRKKNCATKQELA
jgi:hypothetical protein